MANTVNEIGNNTVFLYFPSTDKFNAKKSSIPATSVTFIADTGQIYANGTMFGGNTTTPKAHDSSTTKYGGATASLYGHVKLFDAAGSQAAKDSAAATPYALNAVSTALGGRISTVESGISDLSTALGRTDGRINTDVINYLSAGTGVAVTNDSDSAGKKYGSISVKAKATDVSTSVGGTTPRVYAVGVDKNGDLAVKVNWSVYTHPSHTAINKSSTWLTGITVDTLGHVTGVTNSSLPAATTSAAGIVRLTDSSVSESTTTAPTAGALKSVNDAAKDAKATATAAQATANSKGVVNTVAAGDGVTVTGGSTADVTVKANLGNTAKLTINAGDKVYGVGVDASGKLAVKVPWTDTTANSAIQLTGDVTGSGTSSITTTIKDGAVTSKKIGGFTNSAADFTADASVKVPSAAAVKSFVEGKKYVTSSGVTEVEAGAGLSVSGGTTSKATVSHNTSGVTAGTYRSVTVNELGHVTGGTNPTTISEYGLTDAVSKNGGTLDGNLERRGTSGNTDKGFVVNSVDSSDKSRHKIGLLVATAEDIAGIYDYTNSKWIISDSSTGTVTLNGNANTATSATTAGTAAKLGVNAGSAKRPVYFSGGVPVEGTYTLGTACTKTAGSAAGNVPLIGTALGTTDNVPVVTNASGQLKPHASGSLKSAAFKDASTTVSSSNDIVPTGTAVINYVTSAVNTAVADLAKALKYEGVVTAESGLESTNKGAVYFANAAFTLSAAKSSTGAAEALEKGDMLISDGTGKFSVVNANWTAVDGSAALQWGQTITLATIGGVTIDAQLPASAPSAWGLSNFATKFWKKTDAALTGTITLSPNTMYVWGSAFTGAVTLNQGTAISGIVNEYCGRFIAGSSAVTFTGVTMWNEDRPDITPGSTYEFSIIDNYGILTKLKTF